jgi:cyclic pyranopterin monophosphate synthase
MIFAIVTFTKPLISIYAHTNLRFYVRWSQKMIDSLSHTDAEGQAQMVDVTAKVLTQRTAVAEAFVRMTAATQAAILAGNAPKGDVLGTARIAGIMAAKRTSDLIPLCHPLAITGVEILIVPAPALPGFRLTAAVKVQGQTGVEMEALTAVSVAALTLYDMAKALQKDMTIESIRLLTKTGGKSGDFFAESSPIQENPL